MGDVADSIVERMSDPFYEGHTRYFKSQCNVTKSHIDFKSVIRETEKAWLLLLKEDKEQWYPKEYCIISEEYKDIIVPDWLLKKIEKDSKNEK